MDTFTSFSTSDVSTEGLKGILGDHLALEQLRVFRRLLVRRCGLLALAAFVGARLIPGLSVYARWVPVALFLVPPVWAWVAEFRLEGRLAGRLSQIDKKVIKSS